MRLLQETEFPHLLISPKDHFKVGGRNNSYYDSHESGFSHRDGPVRVPRVRSKDYGKSSHYRVKGDRGRDRDSSKKNFYMSLLQKLLRPKFSRSPRKGKTYSSSSSGMSSGSKYSSPMDIYSSAPMEASPGGWGWGWSGGKGHDHKGVSLTEILLCGLSLLSLGGFLLNLLLNLLNVREYSVFVVYLNI